MLELFQSFDGYEEKFAYADHAKFGEFFLTGLITRDDVIQNQRAGLNNKGPVLASSLVRALQLAVLEIRKDPLCAVAPLLIGLNKEPNSKNQQIAKQVIVRLIDNSIFPDNLTISRSMWADTIYNHQLQNNGEAKEPSECKVAASHHAHVDNSFAKDAFDTIVLNAIDFPWGESRSPQTTSQSQIPERIGLTLSGGGFRATLFHLGVVCFLHDAGLLPRVKFVSGVSGGSILAAHLGLNWKQYTGDWQSFENAAKELIRFTQIDLRNRILRRWLLGWITVLPRLFLGWSRTRLLERHYTNLYRSATLSHLPTQQSGPRVMFQCVSLTTGQPCAFGRSGFMLYQENPVCAGVNRKQDWEEEINAPDLPIALAVAASSAFPPMFPPIKITARDLNCDVKQFPNAQHLTDGGVSDNLGVDRPLWFYENPSSPGEKLDAFLVSDAEGIFDWNEKPAMFNFMLPRNVRATEILMKRLSTATYNYLAKAASLKVVSIGMSQEISVPNECEVLRPEIQRGVRRIRTDFNRFSELEIECLLRHGYAVARYQLASKGWLDPEAAYSWSPTGHPIDDSGRAKEQIWKSQKRSMMSLFSPCDWVTWVLAILMLGGMVLLFCKLYLIS